MEKVLDYYMEPISQLLDQSDVTEIMVNKFDEIFVEKKGVFEKTECAFADEHSVEQLIKQIASHSGGTEASANRDPIVNARLKDGSRFCGVLHPFSPRGSSFSIRKFPEEVINIDDLINFGSMTQEMADYLKSLLAQRLNVIVSGSTGSGKTTLVNALGSFVDPNDRVLTVEDTEELNFTHVKNWLPLVSINKKMEEGGQEVDLSYLITTTLRLNPDRIFVGEIRESLAAVAFIRAINTGHDGCVTTIHANSPQDAMYRLIGEIAASGVPMEFAEQQVWRNVHVVVQAKKIPGHGRKVTSIALIKDGVASDVYRYDLEKRSHVKEG